MALTAAIGIPLYFAGATHAMGALGANIIGAVVIVFPVTIGMAVFESSRREATLGKWVRSVIVVDSRSGMRVSFGRALARNVLKIALPWAVGHAAVYEIVSASAAGSVPPEVVALTTAAYILPVSYVLFLFIGTGRTPYDRICRTAVS